MDHCRSYSFAVHLQTNAEVKYSKLRKQNTDL